MGDPRNRYFLILALVLLVRLSVRLGLKQLLLRTLNECPICLCYYQKKFDMVIVSLTSFEYYIFLMA